LSNGLAALREFISQLPEMYPVDPTRLYLMGFSQGAATCYSFALSDPQSVAGVIALAGFLPNPAREWIVPNCLAHKPIFISHGIQDNDVPLAHAQEAREALTITGATITYREYETGHKLNTHGMRELKAWLSRVVR
jgi:phospholipase/carboxylesterase